ncbi:hypothetical protein [Streptomyces sp. NPDC048200]|uniref:hypothetical protein n=1 Tax=Streptomyces sp. NPDC048200 TaxID=3365512 RepID=UPI003716C0C2
MKFVWLLLALFLTALALGGLMSAGRGGDAPSVIGDLVVSALLGWGAIACWKRVARSSPSTDEAKHR